MHKIGLTGTPGLWIFITSFNRGVCVPIGFSFSYRSSDMKLCSSSIWNCLGKCSSLGELLSGEVSGRNRLPSQDIFHLIEVILFSHGHSSWSWLKERDLFYLY